MLLAARGARSTLALAFLASGVVLFLGGHALWMEVPRLRIALQITWLDAAAVAGILGALSSPAVDASGTRRVHLL